MASPSDLPTADLELVVMRPPRTTYELAGAVSVAAYFRNGVRVGTGFHGMSVFTDGTFVWDDSDLRVAESASWWPVDERLISLIMHSAGTPQVPVDVLETIAVTYPVRAGT